MANFLTDIGRTGGGLTRTATGLTNLALTIRKQRSDEELLPLKRAALETEAEGSRLAINKSRIELEELQAKKVQGNRQIEVTALEKVWNNPEQFKKDYEYMRSLGFTSVLSDGKTEVILAKDLKRFKDEVQSTVAYKQSFNTANLKRYSAEQTQIKAEIDAIEQEAVSKGKSVEDVQKDKRIQQLLPALQTATLGKTRAMLADKAIADLQGKMVSAGIPFKNIEDYFSTGDTTGLVKAQTSGKSTDFEKAYQQHIRQPGNENVLRAEFKTGAYATSKGGLSDDAVLRHFTDIAITELSGAKDAQAMFQRFTTNMLDKDMPRIEAFNEAKEWGLRKTDLDNPTGDYSTLWGETDQLFSGHE